MSKGHLCFHYVAGLLDAFGEMTPIRAYAGVQTNKVTGIMFNHSLKYEQLYPYMLNDHQASYLAEFVIYSSYNEATGLFDYREVVLEFNDNRETFEITKKIQHELFKTELERLMYPLPELGFI